MAQAFEIPLKPATQQKLHISLSGVDYTLSLTFNSHANAGIGLWMLQIGDTLESVLVSGIPLVTGCDLLEQFHYLGIPGALIAQGAGHSNPPPNFTDLGSGSHLFYVLP